jgi:hypothetical protein
LSREPERPEYERRVVGWLRGRLLDNGCPVYYSGGRIRFEDVRLKGAGTRESFVVITFRAPVRGACTAAGKTRSGRRSPYKTLAEHPSCGPRLPKKCVPGAVTRI